MQVRIHQPLWGGFPMHWATGPARNAGLTEDRALAEDYDEADAKRIADDLRAKFPNAVIVQL